MPHGVAEATPADPEHAQGMGFIDQQSGTMARAESGQCLHIGARAFHAEQALADHQRCCIAADVGKTSLEIRQVVVSEALQSSAAGLNAHQQRVVNQPIRQDGAVSIRQGADSGDVGLKAAGKQQHPIAADPVGQGPLKLVMAGSAPGDQP